MSVAWLLLGPARGRASPPSGAGSVTRPNPRWRGSISARNAALSQPWARRGACAALAQPGREPGQGGIRLDSSPLADGACAALAMNARFRVVTEKSSVFPWRAQRAPTCAHSIGDTLAGAREHAFGEDRGAGAKRRARELGHRKTAAHARSAEHASWGI